MTRAIMVVGIVVAALLGLGGPVAAAPVASAGSGPVKLERTNAGSLAPLPKVIANATVSAAIATRINAALRREDARAVSAARDCRASYREMQGKDAGPAWTRSVAVTMAGPRYLAYQVSDSYYCGGPYPNDGLRSDFVYDLATGTPVNWLRLFPKGAKAIGETSAAGASLGLIAWPELTCRAAADAQAECREAFGEGEYEGFTLSLDGNAGALVALPAEFPHVIQACAEEVRLDGATLSKLGFAPELVAALTAAAPAIRAVVQPA